MDAQPVALVETS